MDKSEALCLLGILNGVFFEGRDAGNTKRPDMVPTKKSHAAW